MMIGKMIQPSSHRKKFCEKDFKENYWQEQKEGGGNLIFFLKFLQVHALPKEAEKRLLAVGICSVNDMKKPFKDLSMGQKDCLFFFS